MCTATIPGLEPGRAREGSNGGSRPGGDNLGSGNCNNPLPPASLDDGVDHPCHRCRHCHRARHPRDDVERGGGEDDAMLHLLHATCNLCDVAVGAEITCNKCNIPAILQRLQQCCRDHSDIAFVACNRSNVAFVACNKCDIAEIINLNSLSAMDGRDHPLKN
jgi:hypothetical protein